MHLLGLYVLAAIRPTSPRRDIRISENKRLWRTSFSHTTL